MRIAFSTLACPEWRLERAIGAARRYRYDGIELRMLDGELLSPAIGAAERARVRGIVEHAGLALCCVDTSFEIAAPDAPVDEALSFVELAADLGAPMIRLFGGAPHGEDRRATAARVTEGLAALVERGRDRGVGIAVENHDAFARGDALAEVLADAPADVGVVWDPLNALAAGEPFDRTYAAVRERVTHVHVKDGGVPPDLERNVLIGEGRVPIAEIVATLAADGYDGWLSVEWEKRWQPSIPGADVALPRYAEGLRAILRDLERPRTKGDAG
jgi:sugar phosphate isomerase/epimerase